MKIKKPELWVAAEAKVKKIWDVLQDKRVVHFTMSIKFYRDDLREPKTVSMQGERSADGGWNTWFSKDQNLGALQSPAILKEKLASIEKYVHEYIVENALDAVWKEHEASLKEALKSGLSVEDLEYRSVAPIHASAAYGYDAHFFAPIMATAYAIEGAEALANKNLDRASHCVDRGLYWSNPDMFIPNPKDRFTERASEGGNGRALRHEPVKEMVADLLKQLMPKGGWESTTAAITTVANELTMKYSSFVEKCGLKSKDNNDLERTIRIWIQADPQRFRHDLISES